MARILSQNVGVSNTAAQNPWDSASREHKLSTMKSIFEQTFLVQSSAIDANGHVNNVVYVQWMQDVAIAHWNFLGGNEITRSIGGTWVVRAHRVEYLAPAFEGDMIQARTWVENCQRIRSLRQYEFSRVDDGRLLAKGETDWVFVHADSGKPLAIPAQIKEILFRQPTHEAP